MQLITTKEIVDVIKYNDESVIIVEKLPLFEIHRANGFFGRNRCRAELSRIGNPSGALSSIQKWTGSVYEPL